MFKVGDRVRVVKAGSAVARNVGKEGVVNDDEPSCIGVKIEGEDCDWFYDSSELELVGSSAPSTPTLLDQFAISVAGEAYRAAYAAAVSGKIGGAEVAAITATCAYEVAQAMMKAREVQK